MSKRSPTILGVRLAELEQFRHRIHEIFANLRDGALEPFEALGQLAPPVDVCDTENEVIVWVELPGIDTADIQITFSDGQLRIRGEKREQGLTGQALGYYCLERAYGSLERTIRLDWALDVNRAQAWLAHGVLTVRLPKLSDRRSREILIRVEEGE